MAILINKFIQSRPKKLPEINKIESVAATIIHKNHPIDIVSAYCPHGECDKNGFLQLLHAIGERGIIAGDFNGHHSFWESEATPNRAGSAITGALDEDHRFIICTPKDLGTRRGTKHQQLT